MTHPQHEPPPDRFCDLVMKGGITSGVVYPAAIEQLSRHYRFKSIGGTSAGAIAAALTAAAEYRRRQPDGSRAGFDLLQTLPDQLKAEVAPGRRKLLSLFQPQPKARRLFSVLVGALNSNGTGARYKAVAAGLLRAYWIQALISAALAGAVWIAGAGALAALLTLLVALAVSIGAAVYCDVTRHIVANGYGMCTGKTEDPQHEALTPWLHRMIQQAAGLGDRKKPLTFGDLWDAPGFPVPPFRVAPGATRKSIDLQMFSTSLAHGRPYIFPLAEPPSEPTRFRSRDRLFFSPEELEPYLPTDVMTWMRTSAKAYQLEPGREGRDPSNGDAARLGLLELPPPRDFPVLLAARMSLSFPFLFAAVPLWAIDHNPPRQAGFRRCWFSDGGISSNFPMHLFDGLVPSWPTFGINLEPAIQGRDDVYLPPDYDSGYGERWDGFDDTSRNGATRFGGFLSAIVGTMQNWNDNALSRMPGVRDRIARVRLSAKEGGMNLNMEADVIEQVAQRGQKAALQLAEHFVAAEAAGPQRQGWDQQRFIRLGVLLKLIEERTFGVIAALDPHCPHATSYRELIERAGDAANGLPPGYEKVLSAQQQAALTAVLEALKGLVGSMSEPERASSFKPVPRSELRVRPPL